MMQLFFQFCSTSSRFVGFDFAPRLFQLVRSCWILFENVNRSFFEVFTWICSKMFLEFVRKCCLNFVVNYWLILFEDIAGIWDWLFVVESVQICCSIWFENVSRILLELFTWFCFKMNQSLDVGMQLAIQCGATRVILESDSLNVISKISHNKFFFKTICTFITLFSISFF